jgi:regulator of sigma E protease
MIFTLSGILLLCILVVVHEFGHFIVAKAFGVRVLTFSVGFGPKLLKWKKGDTEYCLSAIPLGGYVKMLGDSPTDELTEEEKGMSFLYQPFWKKSLIALAGPLFNLVLPVFLFTFIYFGNETYLLPIVGSTVPGEPAALSGLRSGDRIKKLNGITIETSHDLDREISARPAQQLTFDVERNQNGKVVRTQVKVMSEALADPNPVNVGETVGHVGLSPYVRRARVAVLDKASPAALAGLKTFDEVLAVNGQNISSFDELESALSGLKLPISLKVKRGKEDKASTIDVVIKSGASVVMPLTMDAEVRRYAVIESELAEPQYLSSLQKTRDLLKEFGQRASPLFGIAFVDGVIAKVEEDTAASSVGLKPGDRIVSVDGKPVDSWYQILKLFQDNPEAMQVLGVVTQGEGRVVALRLKPAKEKSAYDMTTRKVLGVVTTLSPESFKQGETAERYVGMIAAIGRAFGETGNLIKVIGKSLFLLASFKVPSSQMAGPLTIFSAAGEAAKHSMDEYLVLMSLISVNLGILNLLPIPILDGGHLLMFLIEFITRRPLTLKTRQIATSIGLTFILMLMVLAIFNDVTRLAS